MKKINLVLVFIFAVITLKAQSKDDIAIVQGLFGKEKRAVVEEYMKLSAAEAPGFWKVYDTYESQRKANGQQRIALINDYINNLSSLTDAKATELVSKIGQLNLSDDKLLLKTFKDMSKVVSPVKAAQFVQLEKYISASIQMAVQDNIPFIGELENEMNK